MFKAKCANFMDQDAIDDILRRRNEGMMELDRRSGVENPEPMYTLHRNVCHECYYGILGIELSDTINMMNMLTGTHIKRACYGESVKESVSE